MQKPLRRALHLKLFSILMLVSVGCSQLPAGLPFFGPTPTATPRLPQSPLPPVILEYTPEAGEEVSTDAEIFMRFNQTMDTESVAEALRITPAVEGALDWENDERAFVFRPEGLATATRYHVAVGPDAQSVEGVRLSTGLDFSFVTLSPLQVTRVSPEDGDEDMRVDSPVYVAFNRSVVPLECAGQRAEGETCPALPLRFTPAVLGNGSWVNTSLYRFDPFNGWGAGQQYNAVLSEGVESVSGAVLATAYAWSFNTALPYIQEVLPNSGQKGALLDTGVRIFFNTPMDRMITGSVFNVVSETGEAVPGTITWEDNGALLVFTPTQRLALETRYTVRIGERARAVTSAPLENPGVWSFTTVPYPRVTAITPGAGLEEVNVHEPVRISLQGAINSDTLDENVVVSPAPENLYTYFDEETGVYNLSWDKAPRTEYCVSVGTGVADRYTNSLAEEVTSCFTTGDLEPFIGPATLLNVVTLDASEPARFSFVVRNLERVSFVLSELNEAAFIGEREGQRVEIRDWTETLEPPLNVPTAAAVELTRRGGALPTGYYRLSWSAANAVNWHNQIEMAVVDRHVTLKLAPEEALVWVTDLRSSEPISRTEVRLVDEDGVLMAAGTTDGDGLVRIPITAQENFWRRIAAVVGRPGEPGFGIALTNWTADVSPWNFGAALNTGPFVPYHIFVNTDRPLYRPGQKVYFRGVYRQDRDVRYELPSLDERVVVRVTSPTGQEVYSATLPLSDFGTFDGEMSLPPEAELGEYTLRAGSADALVLPWGTTFGVTAYRKPEFEMDVIPERENVLQGDTVRVLVDARYLFGGAVNYAPLHWTIRAEPYFFTPDVTESWQWQPQLFGRSLTSEIVAEGDAKTDEAGRFLIELPASLPELKEGGMLSRRWTVEATLTDESGFVVSERDDLIVHASRFYLGLQPRQLMVEADRRAEVEVLAMDWQGVPLTGQRAGVTLVRRSWYRVSDDDAALSPTWAYTDTTISSANITTNEEGEAVAGVIPPESGTYVVVVESTDSEGNLARSEADLWVSGSEAIQARNVESEIVPVANAASYDVGETAEVLLPIPFDTPYQVLMTVERGGLLSVRRFEFDYPNPVVDLPIVERHVPNVYLSFLVIRGVSAANAVPDVRLGYVTLDVSPESELIDVALSVDKDPLSYTPGDVVTLTVRTTGPEGNPVNAEVGLAMVDKAVLTLRASRLQTILESFYGHRPLQILTGDTLMMLFNRIVEEFERFDGAERLIAQMTVGGLGGGGESAPVPDVRQDFPDTALWMAHLRTDADGEAQVSLKLPDSLTTWVIDAQAITLDTEVGAAQMELVASKPLLVRPVTPRFLVAGDRPEVAAVVHNNTGTDREVKIRLDAVNASVQSPPEQVIRIPAGGRARIAWPVFVPRASGGSEVLLTFSAISDEYEDVVHPAVGEKGVLPVYRYETPSVSGTGGALEDAGGQLESFVVSERAGEATYLTVHVDPSLVAALVQTLSYFEHYPYETNDALVNRVVSNIFAFHALSALGSVDPELESELRIAAMDSIDRLYARQNEDGGWGWWQDWSNLHLSTYAVFGLLKAQDAGVPVRTDVLEAGLSYVRTTLARAMEGESRQAHYAFALYTLTEAGYDWPAGAGNSLYTARDDLGVTGRAYLALAYGLADPSDPRIATLVDGLRGQALVTATGAHWEHLERDSWNTDTSATASVLYAFTTLVPNDPLLSQTVRWLMVARRGDRWETPYESAWSVLALSSYTAAVADLPTAYSWDVVFNGITLGSGTVTSDTLLSPQEIRVGVDAMLRDRPNSLEIVRSEGEGILYYTAHLGISRPVEEVGAEDRGILVRREFCAVAEEEPDYDEGPQPCLPPGELRPGDLVEVRLTLIVPETRHFVLLEAPYPAGAEALARASEDPAAMLSWWGDPFERRELRDDRALFFASNLTPGTYQVAYTLRMLFPGTYRVLPATASELYFPEVWGRSTGAMLEVLTSKNSRR